MTLVVIGFLISRHLSLFLFCLIRQLFELHFHFLMFILFDANCFCCRNLNGVLSENVSSVPLLPTPAAEAGGESSLPAAKRYNCTLCGYSTDRTSRYSRHVQIHSNDRPHQCETCGKGFKLDLYLRKHRCALKSKPAETAAEKSDAGSSPLNLDSLFDPDSFLAATTHQCLACGVAFVNLNDMASHLCSNMLENS